MKKSVLFALGLMIGFTQTVSAQTIFSCTTKNGKIATLDREGNNYVYAFGKPHKTEITLKNSAYEVLSNPLTGVTLHAYGSSNTFVTLNSGQYAYILRLYSSTKYPEQANLYVLKNGKQISNIKCSNWEGEFDQQIHNKEADFDLASDSVDL